MFGNDLEKHANKWKPAIKSVLLRPDEVMNDEGYFKEPISKTNAKKSWRIKMNRKEGHFPNFLIYLSYYAAEKAKALCGTNKLS